MNNNELISIIKKSIQKKVRKIDNITCLAEITDFIGNVENKADIKNCNNHINKPGGLMEDFKKHLYASGKSKTTIKNYTSEADKFINFVKDGGFDFITLTIREVEKYLAMQRDCRKLKENAYSKLIIILRVFLRYLRENKFTMLDISKITIPKKVKTIRQYLNEDDVYRIIEYLNNRQENYRNENMRDLIIMYLGLYCGLRKSEILNLKWTAIDFKDGIINIIRSKGGKSRKVPFNEKIADSLIQYRKKTKNYSNFVIRGSFGRPLTGSSFQNIVRRTFKESGVYKSGLCFHSLRHTYAEWQRKKGTDMFIISELLGHSRIDTTQTYIHVSYKDIKNAVL